MTQSNATVLGSVPLLDINRGNESLIDEIMPVIEEVCRSGWFVLGPQCQRLETSMAELAGAPHGVACASGSDALLLALMAFDIGPGDEVLVPSFTFFATASAVTRLGATPVWVDIDPVTFNIDPERMKDAITAATKAVIPVHLFGQAADMGAINEIARENGLKVIEDAAQAHGAKYNGKPVGSLGDIGCFSFYPTKNLGGFGDGGMLVTSDDETAEKLRLLRVHGMNPRYYHQVIGINSRLDAIQAAVLNVKMPHLPEWTELRRKNAARYDQMFADAGLDDRFTLPATAENRYHVWNQYTLRVPNGQRDELRAFLGDLKVGTEIYYPIALHQQACFRKLGLGDADLPETERATDEVLHLPIFPELTEAEQQTVVARISEYYVEDARAEAA
jgi:dTDP-4-amino-4,6-dideoxygalactose transaminase